MTPRLLNPDDLRAGLSGLPRWRHDAGRGAIARRFEFADFVQAFGFMGRLALVAERLGHHPEWSNVYNRVDIVLTTHDAGGLTALDLQLAQRADTLAAALAA